MSNLHYTPSDKTLFWIAGYTADGNTTSVTEMVKSLTENAQKFAEMVGCELKDVQTIFNTKPPRYQYMRVFFITTDTPPPDAFKWDGDWTFNKVLTS